MSSYADVIIWTQFYHTDAPPDVIRTKLSQLEGALDCESCKAALRAQVDRIVSEWEDTKVRMINVLPFYNKA